MLVTELRCAAQFLLVRQLVADGNFPASVAFPLRRAADEAIRKVGESFAKRLRSAGWGDGVKE